MGKPPFQHRNVEQPDAAEGGYRLRMLASLALSMLAVVLVVRSPWYSTSRDQVAGRPSWPADSSFQLRLAPPASRQASNPASPPAATTPGPIPSPQEVIQEDVGSRVRDEAALKVLPRRETALQFAEKMPQVEGGMNAYYLHIDYPPEAVAQGIEGRLILDFVVLENGLATDIALLTSLHPLCDSAAVRALRRTLFVPGSDGGVPVPVRMRLPVRFQLVDRLPDSGL